MDLRSGRKLSDGRKSKPMNKEQFIKESRDIIKEMFDDVDAGICPQCKNEFEELRQSGPCVYAMPCSHRLWQGNLEAYLLDKEKRSEHGSEEK